MATELDRFGRAAASADPLAYLEAAAHAPPLHKITKAEAAEIESLAAKHHGGTVEKGSFAAVAQSAADINERRATQHALEHTFPDTFGALAASAVPAHVEQATAIGPPLRSITLAQAAAVTREAVKAARRVEHGSFASLCQSAAERLARARRDVAAAAELTTEGAESTWRSSVVVPLSAGGDAAAARTLDFDKVCSALRGTPFDLDTIDMEHLRLLESAAARDHGG
jgi:Seed maturation protein